MKVTTQMKDRDLKERKYLLSLKREREREREREGKSAVHDGRCYEQQ